MDKLNNTSKIVIGAVVVIAVILLAVTYGNGNKAPASNTTSTSQNGGTTSGNVLANSPTTGKTGNTPRVTVPPPIIIHFVTPVASDHWTIGASDPIAWDNAANFSGEIDLVDGKTHNFIGVILSETGPNQTSYSWDTREYSLARYSPLKKEVVPGTYAIRLKFDGNNLPTLVSPSFTISN